MNFVSDSVVDQAKKALENMGKNFWIFNQLIIIINFILILPFSAIYTLRCGNVSLNISENKSFLTSLNLIPRYYC